jgi:putative transposase
MTRGLVRYQQSGQDHFITFSCYHRKPYLASLSARVRFEHSLERVRIRYGLVVIAYVVMPEHVHLLLTESAHSTLARALQALKISAARPFPERPFWQARYYDFNVLTRPKLIEKLRYIHRNPVKRGLVVAPEDWPWSSYRHYASRETGRVALETWCPTHPRPGD